MIDSLRANVTRARESDILSRLDIREARYGVVTLHRPANVDSGPQLREIMSALEVISETLPIYFPVHPRTRSRLNGHLGRHRISFVDPLGYLDFLCLVSNSSAVFTDSGGIQEETTVLGVPCFTLRENTERPSTIEHGTNVLAGVSSESILNAWTAADLTTRHGRVPPLWDGRAADRCVEAIHAFFNCKPASLAATG